VGVGSRHNLLYIVISPQLNANIFWSPTFRHPLQVEGTELAELTEVLFATAFDTLDGEDSGVDMLEDEEMLQAELDDQEGDEVLEAIALRAFNFVPSTTGDGSRGPYNGIPRSNDYFATLLQQPDERFRYAFRLIIFMLLSGVGRDH